ncbi:PIN domain-containing protein [Candidatus Pacearchaeota archaeon]|nr:PIN domain-containing protein [Candidatus Pacearchaeota archaeon]
MNKEIQRIILDTNFLVYCAEKKVDYVESINNLMSSGYELVVPNQVVEELMMLASKAKKLSDRSAALLALHLLKHNKIKQIETTGKNADQGIVKISKGNIVATLDRVLKKKVEKSIVLNYKGKLSFG